MKRFLSLFGFSLVDEQELKKLEEQNHELIRKLFIVSTKPGSDEAMIITTKIFMESEIDKLGLYGNGTGNLTGLTGICNATGIK